jgi:hypothetical protein
MEVAACPLGADAARGDLSRLNAGYEAYGDWNPWQVMAQIAAPILMFVGELEDPEGWNSRAALRAQNGRVVRLGGLDHPGDYIRSDLVLPSAIEFLNGN